MIAQSLVAEAQRLIHRMQPLSETSASQGGQIGHGHPSSGIPPGVAFTVSGSVTHTASTLEQFGARVNLAEAHDSDSEMADAIRWGITQLHSIQHGPKQVAETPAQFRRRLGRDYEGVPAAKVAARERCSVTTVRDARVADGRDARAGHKLKIVAGDERGRP